MTKPGTIYLVLLIVFTLISCQKNSQIEKIVISGKVTDFEGSPIDSAFVQLKEKGMKTLYSTYSNKDGLYSLNVPKGNYNSMAIIRMADYGKTKLEFWAWNIIAYKDLAIDSHYDKLEVYGVNIFRVQGAYPGYTIYCRPMSLSRFKIVNKESKIMDIAPEIENLAVSIEINDKLVKVNSIQRIEEYAGEQKMYAYLFHVELGEENKENFNKFRIVLEDKKYGDKGEAIYFLE